MNSANIDQTDFDSEIEQCKLSNSELSIQVYDSTEDSFFGTHSSNLLMLQCKNNLTSIIVKLKSKELYNLGKSRVASLSASDFDEEDNGVGVIDIEVVAGSGFDNVLEIWKKELGFVDVSRVLEYYF